MSIAALSLLAACEISTGAGEDGFGYEPKGLTVTFNSNGGSPVSPITGVQLYSTISKPEDPVKGHKFEGWFKDADCHYDWDFDIDIVTGNITLYAKWGAYDGSLNIIGKTGPGGGKIFYQSSVGFTMSDTGEKCHYLEAAPGNWKGGSDPTLVWSSVLISVPGGTGPDIGEGRKNTVSILNQSSSAPAAFACKEYRGNNKDDWFLPSINELHQLYVNRTLVGLGDSTEIYWSSSEQGGYDSDALYKYFGNGNQSNTFKNVSYSVRPIRAF